MVKKIIHKNKINLYNYTSHLGMNIKNTFAKEFLNTIDLDLKSVDPT